MNTERPGPTDERNDRARLPDRSVSGPPGERILMFPTAYAHGTVGMTIRALSIARALRRQGCEVAFVTSSYSASLIARDGFQIFPCPVPTPAGTLEPNRSVIHTITWTGLGNPDIIAGLVQAELAAIETFQPTAAWAELRPSAVISCGGAGVPLAAIANWPIHPAFPPNRAENPTTETFNRFLRAYGLPPVRSSMELLFMRADLHLAPTLPELEPELADADPDVVFLGHTVDRTAVDRLPDWFGRWAGDRLGFAYLSVSGLQPALYASILSNAFAGTRFRLLCATGYPLSLEVLPADTAEVRFVHYIPALPVIERSRFLIFHAGHDTMMSALYHGVPSIAVPGASAEREYNAARLAECGAGMVLPLAGFRPKRLLALTEQLTAGGWVEAAARIASRLKAAGGCEEAATRILDLARARRYHRQPLRLAVGGAGR